VTELHVPSYAKVNLFLDVGEKRPEDGYHYIRTVMMPISLQDDIVLREAHEITVRFTPDLPGPPETNLAYRAAHLLKDATGYPGGAAIEVRKRIPVAGGLAGGSTNGAAVLTGLNRLWGTGLTDAQLISLAIGLGSDVPFFVPGRPARVEGIGEVVTPIRTKHPLWLVLATPEVAKSTGNVFRLYDELPAGEHPDLTAMEAALGEGDLPGVAASLANVFERVMLPLHPEIAGLKEGMLRAGALGALMSGAGPTVFGLVEGEEAGHRLLKAIRPLAPRACLVHSVGSEA